MHDELERKYGRSYYDCDNRETRRKKGRRSGFKLSAKLPVKQK